MARRIEGLVLAAALLAVSAPARATTQPNDRNGFMIGFGVGGGSLGVEDLSDREGSVTGNFRLGWAVRPDLVLGLESNGWTKTFEGTPGDLTWTYNVAAAALTWYPGAGGAYLRGGVGAGMVRAELESGNLTISGDDTGIGLTGAAGYEWRLTRKFAMGPEVNVFWMDVDAGSANVLGGTLNFDWYW